MLWASGRIASDDFPTWISALRLVSIIGTGPILMDLSELRRWNAAAQVATMEAAQRATGSGRSLALCRPHPLLRAATRLPVFERVPTYEEPAEVVVAMSRFPRPRTPGASTEG